MLYSDGGLSVTATEIDWWEIHRPEIFSYVDKGEIWMDPETGARLTTCPWLRVETKPLLSSSKSTPINQVITALNDCFILG